MEDDYDQLRRAASAAHSCNHTTFPAVRSSMNPGYSTAGSTTSYHRASASRPRTSNEYSYSGGSQRSAVDVQTDAAALYAHHESASRPRTLHPYSGGGSQKSVANNQADAAVIHAHHSSASRPRMLHPYSGGGQKNAVDILADAAAIHAQTTAVAVRPGPSLANVQISRVALAAPLPPLVDAAPAASLHTTYSNERQYVPLRPTTMAVGGQRGRLASREVTAAAPAAAPPGYAAPATNMCPVCNFRRQYAPSQPMMTVRGLRGRIVPRKVGTATAARTPRTPTKIRPGVTLDLERKTRSHCYSPPDAVGRGSASLSIRNTPAFYGSNRTAAAAAQGKQAALPIPQQDAIVAREAYYQAGEVDYSYSELEHSESKGANPRPTNPGFTYNKESEATPTINKVLESAVKYQPERAMNNLCVSQGGERAVQQRGRDIKARSLERTADRSRYVSASSTSASTSTSASASSSTDLLEVGGDQDAGAGSEPIWTRPNSLYYPGGSSAGSPHPRFRNNTGTAAQQPQQPRLFDSSMTDAEPPMAVNMDPPTDPDYGHSHNFPPGADLDSPEIPKYEYGRIRRFDVILGKYGPWQPLFAHDADRAGGSSLFMSRPCVIKLKRGGTLRYFPKIMSEERRMGLAQACRSYQDYRQYKFGPGGIANEPRVHVLLAAGANAAATEDASQAAAMNTAPGYQYHGIKMQAKPLSSQPEFESLSVELAAATGLPDNEWNIGCDAIVYRNGNDHIGWHADDTQGESKVMCIVPESPGTSRPVHVRPKIKGGAPLENGDEEIQLYIRQGDGYEMDGVMQIGYEHCLPKMKKVEGLRSALIFRQGCVASMRDTGHGIAEKADGGDILAPPAPLPTFIGHLPPDKLVEGCDTYSRADLFISRAHRCDRRGVCGNITNGAESIVVSRQCPELREEDGLEWLKYTSSRRQGAGGFATSYKLEQPIRVFRSSSLNNSFAPPPRTGGQTAYRYDGLYKIHTIYDEHGNETQEGPSPNGAQYTFLLKRLPFGDVDGCNSCNRLSIQQLWGMICDSKGMSSCEFKPPEPNLCLDYLPFQPTPPRKSRRGGSAGGAGTSIQGIDDSLVTLTLGASALAHYSTFSRAQVRGGHVHSTRIGIQESGAVSPRGGDEESESDNEASDINWVQCDRCDKWRILPTGAQQEMPTSGEWYCELNIGDPLHNNCNAPEQTEDDSFSSAEDSKVCNERSGKKDQNEKGKVKRKNKKSGYNIFFSEHALRLKQAKAAGSPPDFGSIATLVASAWRELSSAEKLRYQREADLVNRQRDEEAADGEEREKLKKRRNEAGKAYDKYGRHCIFPANHPFYLFLHENRASIERKLKKKEAYFDMMKQDYEKNYLIVKEGEAVWCRLGKNEQNLYMAPSSLQTGRESRGNGDERELRVWTVPAPEIGPGWTVETTTTCASTKKGARPVKAVRPLQRPTSRPLLRTSPRLAASTKAAPASQKKGTAGKRKRVVPKADGGKLNASKTRRRSPEKTGQSAKSQPKKKEPTRKSQKIRSIRPSLRTRPRLAGNTKAVPDSERKGIAGKRKLTLLEADGGKIGALDETKIKRRRTRKTGQSSQPEKTQPTLEGRLPTRKVPKRGNAATTRWPRKAKEKQVPSEPLRKSPRKMAISTSSSPREDRGKKYREEYHTVKVSVRMGADVLSDQPKKSTLCANVSGKSYAGLMKRRSSRLKSSPPHKRMTAPKSRRKGCETPSRRRSPRLHEEATSSEATAVKYDASELKVRIRVGGSLLPANQSKKSGLYANVGGSDGLMKRRVSGLKSSLPHERLTAPKSRREGDKTPSRRRSPRLHEEATSSEATTIEDNGDASELKVRIRVGGSLLPANQSKKSGLYASVGGSDGLMKRRVSRLKSSPPHEKLTATKSRREGDKTPSRRRSPRLHEEATSSEATTIEDNGDASELKVRIRVGGSLLPANQSKKSGLYASVGGSDGLMKRRVSRLKSSPPHEKLTATKSRREGDKTLSRRRSPRLHEEATSSEATTIEDNGDASELKVQIRVGGSLLPANQSKKSGLYASVGGSDGLMKRRVSRPKSSPPDERSTATKSRREGDKTPSRRRSPRLHEEARNSEATAIEDNGDASELKVGITHGSAPNSRQKGDETPSRRGSPRLHEEVSSHASAESSAIRNDNASKFKVRIRVGGNLLPTKQRGLYASVSVSDDKPVSQNKKRKRTIRTSRPRQVATRPLRKSPRLHY